MRTERLLLVAGLSALGVWAWSLTRNAAALPAPPAADPVTGYPGDGDSGGEIYAPAVADPADAGQFVTLEGDTSSKATDNAGAVSGFLLPAAYAVQNFFFSATGQRMQISMAGVAEVSRHEGLRLAPYKDQAGLWTIGYGHLLRGGEWYDSITEAFALKLLTDDLGVAEDAVNSLVRVAVSQSQFDALVSLVFNIGAGAFRNSTLLRRLNAGDYNGAQAQFFVWNKVRQGGALVVSNGLTNRRYAEAALFGAGGVG